MKSNKSHHQEGAGGCRQQELHRKRWDWDPPRGAQTMAAIIRVNAVHPKPCWEQVLTEAGSCISHSCCSPPSHSLLCSTQCTLSNSLLKNTTMGCYRLSHPVSKEQMQMPPLGESFASIAWRECREHAKTLQSHSRSGE